MEIALCYESVLPSRGGAETYISDLARRLARDGHAIHLYASRWDTDALPAATHYHRIDVRRGPRFLRPWRFAAACEDVLKQSRHDVSIGFDKTWGQDILYPQGGLHAAACAHNLLKYSNCVTRTLAAVGKRIDPAAQSFALLERKQYLGPDRPCIVVNSRMVQHHFEQYYGIAPESIRVIHSAIDPTRFSAEDRPKRRFAERGRWVVFPEETVALFVAMNYRLKGLAALLNSIAIMPRDVPFKLVVVGHPNFRRYQRLAESLGIVDRVRFLGHRDDPRDCYFAADFLVHPTFYDPCSLVALEALACGLPVLTTRYNGASELLSPPNDGLVIDDPHNSEALAVALTRFTDRRYRGLTSSAARETGTKWTFEDHYQSLLNLFREVRQLKQAA